MSGKTIRRDEILKALERQHEGQILAGGNIDAVGKLLRSLTLRDGLRNQLCKTLREMASDGVIIIGGSGNRFSMIALPTAVPSTESGGQQDMATPRTLRKTTYPRTGDGKDLPSTLTDDMVGPVTTRHLSPSAEGEIEAMAGLVVDQFCDLRKARMAHSEVLTVIQTVFVQLHGEMANAIMEATANQVFVHLVDSRKLRRDPCSEGKSRSEAVYLFRLPEQAQPESSEPQTQVTGEMATRLTSTTQELEARVTDLTRQLEEARETHVSKKTLERTLAMLEAAGEDNESLRRKLQEGDETLQRIQRAHTEELTRQRTQHEATLREVQGRLEASEATNRRLEAELADQQLDKIPADLIARMEKLGIPLDD